MFTYSLAMVKLNADRCKGKKKWSWNVDKSTGPPLFEYKNNLSYRSQEKRSWWHRVSEERNWNDKVKSKKVCSKPPMLTIFYYLNRQYNVFQI